MTTENLPGTEELYRAAVGLERADFYVPKFLRFDVPGSSKVSWNWPAFFVAFFWGIYRRMYLNSLIFCWVVPIFLLIVLSLLAVELRKIGLAVLCNLAMLTYTWIIIPMFANAVYHRFILRRINEVRAKVSDPVVQMAVLENAPHTSQFAWVGILFLLVPVTGIIAAIAIPAYQMYTIRSQIAEGLRLAGPVEKAVSSAYSATGVWPADATILKLSQPLEGSYVADIEVDKGTITIRYGNRANRLIYGQTLSIRPTVGDREAFFACGYANPPGGDPVSGPAGPNRTNIPRRYLPGGCRGTAR